jgi:dTDP-4-amino-4,6-dideoxygalactose transaminase
MKLFETKIDSQDIEIISEVLKSGDLGFGPNVFTFEQRFKKFSSKVYNVATNSASASAFIIFSFLREKYGVCDVYTTSLGFTSPAWAAKHFGHNLIFVDVQNDLQFDSRHYKKVRRDTKNQIVVMPVLYGGVSNINCFSLVGDEIVVVDSAHCATPTIQSDFIFFSFHPYKPICTSDGGMISTDIKEAAEYFKNYRNFGRRRAQMSYDIIGEGFKFYMNNLNATIGLTQIKKYEENLLTRKENYVILKERFKLLDHDKMSSYYFATTFVEDADRIIKNTGLTRNYPMLHKASFYRNGVELPILESLHRKILNLPLTRVFNE